MTISDLYVSGVDVKSYAKIVIYPSYNAMAYGDKDAGEIYDDIVNLPFTTYARTAVKGFRIEDGNVHVYLGGEW